MRNVEHLALHRFHHVVDGDFSGPPSKRTATSRSASAAHNPRSRQGRDLLLDESARQTEVVGQVARGDVLPFWL